MQLYLVRHAAAVPRSSGVDDAARPLTRDGRKRWARAVDGLDRLGVRLDRLYHSPWRRAAETAEPLASLADETVATERLARAPDDALLGELAGERVALVGHEPWMGELLALLVGAPHAAPHFAFKKGGVAWLEGEPRAGGMTLKALLVPKVLRALAR